MIIKIKLGDGTEKDVEISIKKKHRNKYLDNAENLQNNVDSKDGKEITTTKAFLEFEDSLAVECSNITQEEYDDLDLDEAGKITKAIRMAAFPHAGGDPSLFFQKSN